MNIFVIARGYPSLKEPTWGCFEKDQAEALAQAGHKITILSVDTRFRWYWRKIGMQHHVNNQLSIFNIFILPYALLFFIPKRIKDLFYTWLLEFVYKHAVEKQGKPDILFSHYLHNTQKAVYLHQKYNIPLVGMEHWSQMAFTPIPKHTIQLAKRVYPSIDQLLTVSSYLKQNIIQQIGIDSIVVPNMVSSNFQYCPKQQNNNTIKIVTTGRLVKEKRIDLILHAIANINAPIELNIIGNGTEINNLILLAHQLKIEQQIHFLGYKTKQEIVHILQQSDLFVLPSQSETFGVAYIEALACGLPIIATDCGGPRDIVSKMNGILIPINDIDALTKALSHLINHLDQYNRQEIAQDCQARFSSEVIAKKLTSIFEETIRNSKVAQ